MTYHLLPLTLSYKQGRFFYVNHLVIFVFIRIKI